MIASIGPFWDANETWLVLGVGILLIAFPKAHGMVLTALYLPVALMLIGLILRGVAFDFRVKAQDEHKPLWNRAFFAGSAGRTAQGWMLGRYITGFAEGWVATASPPSSRCCCRRPTCCWAPAGW
jgi:cytochrome bd ubiquinol oxidase subunit II